MTPAIRTKSASIFVAVAMASMAFHIPAHGEVSVLNSSSPAAGGAGLTVSATDLVNQGQATFLNYTEGSPTFGAGTANEGTATNLTSSGAFYRTTQLPATLVFNLDVSTNTLGYDLTQIDSLAGWQGGGTQTYANQNFTVEYSVVGNAGFSALTAVDYSPFTSTTSGDPAYTQSRITDTTGLLASGVDALRFVYSDPSISGGTNRGLVLLEIDIAGTPTGPAGPDNTPPNLAGGDIVDDKSGGPVVENTQVTYTVTFSEDIDAATVSAADFGNAGSALIDIGTISEISPGVFRVRVTPTSVGTLQLQVATGAVIKDPAGNSLDTTSAILDDTTIAITEGPLVVMSYVYDGVSIGTGNGDGTQPSTFNANFLDDGAGRGSPPPAPNTELTDGLLPPGEAFNDAAWVGFRDDDRNLEAPHPQITFDLGVPYDVATVNVTYLHSTTQAGGTITAPEELLISVSSDNVTYSAPTSFSAEFDSSGGNEIRVARVDISALDSGQYYRLDFRNASQWTFLAEVEFDGVVSAPGDPLKLSITRDGANLVFQWASNPGKLYNLRSVTDPSSAEPRDWPVFDGNEGLAATPDTNTLTLPHPDDSERFFVIEEFPAPPVTVFSDDFESGQGAWTVGSQGDSGSEWELGTPSNVGPPAANSGGNCFGTNLDGDYEFNADVWLRSPAIDLTSVRAAILSYAEFKDIENLFDSGTINVLAASDDSLLGEIASGIEGSSTQWDPVTHQLPAEALGKVIKIEFRLNSDNFTNLAGWYIDDVVVTTPAP